MKRPKPRAAVILLQDENIALIERHRPDKYYFVFPGGGINKGETPTQAAVRETEEELGVQVTIDRLVAEVWYNELPQYYFLAELTGGEFGSGQGKEMNSPADSFEGSYHPCWIPLADLLRLPVLPSVVARYVYDACLKGWPEHPLFMRDATID
jgi:8-oxo-dGTP diphosphatase